MLLFCTLPGNVLDPALPVEKCAKCVLGRGSACLQRKVTTGVHHFVFTASNFVFLLKFDFCIFEFGAEIRISVSSENGKSR
jgi:hypothetical protein